MKSDRRPPVARSPMKLRGRQLLESTVTTPMRTPIGSARTKTQIPNPTFKNNTPAISNDLEALKRMVQSDLINFSSNPTTNLHGTNSASVFERGRFYDQYSARRNERLKKKKQNETGEAFNEPKSAYNLGVKKVESVKKKDSKKFESLKKGASAVGYTADRSAHPRYALRSIKKPPLPVPMNVDDGVGARRKTRGQRAIR